MAVEHRTIDAESLQRVAQQRRLLLRRPHAIAGPCAVAEAGAIEGDHPMRFGEWSEDAECDVLEHAAVAMQQDYWRALAGVYVMQANAIHGDELPLRRMPALGPPGLPVDDERGAG